MGDDLLDAGRIESLDGLCDWQIVDGALVARYATRDFATGLDFVNRVGALAEQIDHHPDLTLTYSSVGVALISHDVGGLTMRDVELAREITGVAAECDLAAVPAEPG